MSQNKAPDYTCDDCPYKHPSLNVLLHRSEAIQQRIESSIRAHEIRVAIVSGIIGGLLIFGTWHAIWMLNQ